LHDVEECPARAPQNFENAIAFNVEKAYFLPLSGTKMTYHQLGCSFMLFSAAMFHRTSANFNFVHAKRQNLCVDLNHFLCDFKP
jgi:hypothetical protein